LGAVNTQVGHICTPIFAAGNKNLFGEALDEKALFNCYQAR